MLQINVAPNIGQKLSSNWWPKIILSTVFDKQAVSSEC